MGFSSLILKNEGEGDVECGHDHVWDKVVENLQRLVACALSAVVED